MKETGLFLSILIFSLREKNDDTQVMFNTCTYLYIECLFNPSNDTKIILLQICIFKKYVQNTL